MLHFLKDMSIKNKARFALIGVALLIMGIFLLVSNFFIKDRMINMVINKYEEIAIKQFEHMEYVLESSVGVVERIARNDKIRKALNTDWEDIDDREQRELKKYLQSIILERGEFSRIVITGSQGDIRFYSDKEKDILEKYSLKEQFVGTDDVFFCRPIILREVKKVFQPITYPIYENEDEKGNRTGYVVAFFIMNVIDDSLSIIDVGEKGEAFLTTDDGLVLSSSGDYEYGINRGEFDGYYTAHKTKKRMKGFHLANPENGALVPSIKKCLNTHRGGHMTYINNEGELVIGVWKWLSYFKWVFLMEVNWYEAFSPLIDTLIVFVIVGSLIMVLVIVLAWMLSKSIDDLLHAFMDSFSLGALGDLSARFPVPAGIDRGVQEWDESAGEYRKYDIERGFCFFRIGSIAGNLGRDVTCRLIRESRVKDCRRCRIYRKTLRNEVWEMGAWFNLFMENLAGVVLRVKDLIDELFKAADTMSQTTSSFSENASNQAASAQEIMASVEESSANFENISKRIGEQKEILEGMVARVNDLSELIETMGIEVEDARSSTENFSNKARTGEESLQFMDEVMRKISKSSGEMITMLEVINDISDQINLLSLNASIEAARAGEQGRGFAVVAEEISKLADNTAQSLKNIDTLIKENEQEVQQGLSRVGEAVSTIAEVIEGFESITSMMEVIAKFMKRQIDTNSTVNQEVARVREGADVIRTAAQEQKQASEEIVKSISLINELTQHNAEGSEELAGNASNVAEMAENLRESVKFFKN